MRMQAAERARLVRAMRDEQHLTYQQIADELGVSRERIRQIDNHARHPSGFRFRRCRVCASYCSARERCCEGLRKQDLRHRLEVHLTAVVRQWIAQQRTEQMPWPSADWLARGRRYARRRERAGR
jgi:hypothetical protein